MQFNQLVQHANPVPICCFELFLEKYTCKNSNLQINSQTCSSQKTGPHAPDQNPQTLKPTRHMLKFIKRMQLHISFHFFDHHSQLAVQLQQLNHCLAQASCFQPIQVAHNLFLSSNTMALSRPGFATTKSRSFLVTSAWSNSPWQFTSSCILSPKLALYCM